MNKIIFQDQSKRLEFRISIVDYQFPEIKTDYDGNWLVVKYECYYKGKKFIVEDPSLFTTDLKRISNWFQSISKNIIPETVTIGFLEPNLEFILYSSKMGIIEFGIKLDLEAKPPFVFDEDLLDYNEGEYYEFEMLFESTFEELNTYSESFSELYNNYPQRGDF